MSVTVFLAWVNNVFKLLPIVFFYWNIYFIATIWNWTQNISKICLQTEMCYDGKSHLHTLFFFSHWFSILFSFLVGGKKKKKNLPVQGKKKFLLKKWMVFYKYTVDKINYISFPTRVPRFLSFKYTCIHSFSDSFPM